MSTNEAEVRARFVKTAAKVAELEEQRRDALREKVASFVHPRGDEIALDSGTGTGALAFALAPLVKEVIAVDLVPELLAEGERRAGAFPNVSFREADATRLPFGPGSFDLVGTLRTLHHVARPELAIAELSRVTRPGGTVLVVDQIAPIDPLAALELNSFERTRDPSHTRALSEGDLRGLFEANGLVLRRDETEREERDLHFYLDLAGCEGEARDRALQVAPPGSTYSTMLGWYLLHKPGIGA